MKNFSCVFAGTFDPITLGHINVIEKCLKKYQKVIIVVGENANKTPLFSVQERLSFVSEVFSHEQNVEVYAYNDYKDDYYNFLLSKKAFHYVRGIRNSTDKKYEKAQIKLNKKLYPFIKTKFIKCDKEFSEISSTKLKERLQAGKSLDTFVPQQIESEVVKAFKQKQVK